MAAERPALPKHARRWDAVVLGSALPGLVAATRLAIQGQRVLVVEETAATETPALVREPFFLAGARGGLLDATLRELGIPLIERRALAAQPTAFQMILPDARLELGEPQLWVDELVAWGIAKPDPVRALTRALAHAGQAELGAMQSAPLLKVGALRNLSRGGGRTPSLHGRGLPVEASETEGIPAVILDAAIRALSNLGATRPAPEARARLLGTVLEGGAAFPASDLGLRALLLRRLRGRHGEIRTIQRPFSFAAAGQHPAIAVDGVGELWAGRVLVMNAPASRLAARLEAWDRPAPAFLATAQPATHRRVTVHFRAETDAIPEGMGRALVRVADPTRPCEGTQVVTLARTPRPESEQDGDIQDLVAAAVVEDRPESHAAVADEIEAAVRELMPFCGERLVRLELPEPAWDDDFALADPARGEGWPGEIEIRASSRPPVYQLAREGVAGLGLEGDLLLGWRAGDAIGADLA